MAAVYWTGASLIDWLARSFTPFLTGAGEHSDGTILRLIIHSGEGNSVTNE